MIPWVVAAGVLAGAVSQWIFRRLTDTRNLRVAVNRVMAHLMEIQLFGEEPGVVLRAQLDLIRANGQALLGLAKPLLVLTVFFAATLAGMEAMFGSAPLRLGQAALVTLKPVAPGQKLQLQAPPGLTVDEPPVYVAAEQSLVWRVRATAPFQGELRAGPFSRRVVAGEGLALAPLGNGLAIAYPKAQWLWWFCGGSLLGALLPRFIPALLLCLLVGCGHAPSNQVIVLGVDGMDPGFVERHWDSLPNLKALKERGYFGPLRTTAPPQSPVAWSSFITGLEPDGHGIYDFVHRNPQTRELFSSMSKTEEPKYSLPLGPYVLPLSTAHVHTLRHGVSFWKTLADGGVPVMVQRMPINFPPEAEGIQLAGMGTPDLLGTLGTFTFFTDDPEESARDVPGGRIAKAQVSNGRAELRLDGPENPLRRDRAGTSALLTVDIDPDHDVARIQVGRQAIVLMQGEWSPWLSVEFPLIKHVVSVHGLIRIFAKQLHPGLALYVSPINLDPTNPALPVSHPAAWASDAANKLGPFSTLGIPEDTSAPRQQVLSLAEFRAQAELVFREERRLLEYSLAQYRGGFFFFYFSSVDQNSHMLWAKHEDELLKVYREVDECLGLVRRQESAAKVFVISDHGFTTFDRAVHLNSWLKQNGFGGDAYAVGLNGLYMTNNSARERLRAALLQWTDGGRRVIDKLMETAPAAQNKTVAPDYIVGYAAGYRASWQTALGEAPDALIEDNTDAWIGDHCVNPDVVPGVLFSSEPLQPKAPGLADVTAGVLKRFGYAPPAGYRGHPL